MVYRHAGAKESFWGIVYNTRAYVVRRVDPLVISIVTTYVVLDYIAKMWLRVSTIRLLPRKMPFRTMLFFTTRLHIFLAT